MTSAALSCLPAYVRPKHSLLCAVFSASYLYGSPHNGLFAIVYMLLGNVARTVTSQAATKPSNMRQLLAMHTAFSADLGAYHPSLLLLLLFAAILKHQHVSELHTVESHSVIMSHTTLPSWTPPITAITNSLKLCKRPWLCAISDHTFSSSCWLGL